MTLIDSETREEVKVSITPKSLKEYKKTLDNYRLRLEELASKYGATFIEVDSEDAIEKVILKNFTAKELLY